MYGKQQLILIFSLFFYPSDQNRGLMYMALCFILKHDYVLNNQKTNSFIVENSTHLKPWSIHEFMIIKYKAQKLAEKYKPLSFLFRYVSDPHSSDFFLNHHASFF